MPEHTSIAVEYASALAHPVRLRLVAALADGPRTVTALASELDVPEAAVVHHAEALRMLGLVEAHRHADGTRTYEPLRAPVIWDKAWGDLALEEKRAAAAATVTNVSARATAAVDRGGFDREDMHLTRTTLTVDEEGWRVVARLLGRTLHELGDLEEQPVPEGETFRATAVLMLFSSEHVEVDEPAGRAYSENETRALVTRLREELDEALADDPVDWSRVERLAHRMRAVARSAQEAPDAPVIPLHRD